MYHLNIFGTSRACQLNVKLNKCYFKCIRVVNTTAQFILKHRNKIFISIILVLPYSACL